MLPMQGSSATHEVSRIIINFPEYQRKHNAQARDWSGKEVDIKPMDTYFPSEAQWSPLYLPLPVIHAVSPLFLFYDETCRL